MPPIPPLNISAGGAGPLSGQQTSRATGGFDGSGWGVNFAPVGDQFYTPSAALYKPDAFGLPDRFAAPRVAVADGAINGLPAGWVMVAVVLAVLALRRG